MSSLILCPFPFLYGFSRFITGRIISFTAAVIEAISRLEKCRKNHIEMNDGFSFFEGLAKAQNILEVMKEELK